ncbi:hypothetical protein GCM10011328_00290 [Hafnia psychrotolerans]|uniref:Uncharacterized protein n=1 Tax=Hafnia psychrotolerans TaxID=1477018 RepID=A0ABQ1FSX4_9GAMM|nr:hypothetical protein GCM10011328_00290 [Hafnia psychrotolerans]
MFHEKARSPEARATAGLWSVWADAHGLDVEFVFDVDVDVDVDVEFEFEKASAAFKTTSNKR